MAELNTSALTTLRERTVRWKAQVGSEVAGQCGNRNSGNNSSARPGCEDCYNSHTRVIPQTGVTRVIRLIYIHNTAQGDEHDNLPSTETEPCGGRETQPRKSFNGRRLF